MNNYHRSCHTCNSAVRPDGGNPKACGQCQLVRYCSTDCQSLNWPDHKPVCRFSRNALKNSIEAAYGNTQERRRLQDLAEAWFTSASSHLKYVALDRLQVDLVSSTQQLIENILWVTIKTSFGQATEGREPAFDISSMRTLPIREVYTLPDIIVNGDNLYKNGFSEVLALREQQRQLGAEAIIVVAACPVFSLFFFAVFAVVST
ncbi:hypothetical protein CPB83DRAFT_900984 [Crepidotus variabilis]|uniref:MYND-type domain-containing protein n=1 Tax=Crepidotus variabilis TaxID=179855 RepID=A0A9P6E0Z1_9AGAR|nr:hypothetical protein CPB83DRAFT_900984 [Crepidotus variabilis]